MWCLVMVPLLGSLSAQTILHESTVTKEQARVVSKLKDYPVTFDILLMVAPGALEA